MAKQTEQKGLKGFRNNPTSDKIKCENCGCERFGKCGCVKRAKNS